MKVSNIKSIGKSDIKKVTDIKTGSLVKVKNVKTLDKTHSLIQIGGKRFIAFLRGKINSDYYIARVLKTTPTLELKFIKGLVIKEKLQNIRNYFFAQKKEFIQNLIDSDNFLVDDFIKMSKNGENFIDRIKDYFRLSQISKKSLDNPYFLNELLKGKGKIIEYFIQQSIYNFYQDERISLILPLLLNNERIIGDFEIVKNDSNNSNIFVLNIFLTSNKRIIFLIYLDYEAVSCSVSTNEAKIKDKIINNLERLKLAFKRITGRSSVDINFVPYNYLGKVIENGIKTIDVRM